jgi:hypothetical protein
MTMTSTYKVMVIIVTGTVLITAIIGAILLEWAKLQTPLWLIGLISGHSTALLFLIYNALQERPGTITDL